MKPLMVDLYCGLGGWAEGGLAEGFDVIGFDIERHVYGEHRYPAQLVVQDVTTLHGSQFKSANLLVASPPCQKFSYMAMPWSAGKAKAKAISADESGEMLADLTALFEACFRIQREACEAAGRHIPLVVENVRGAQPWVGRARWNFGSYYLWGDVPALMPAAFKGFKSVGMNWIDPTKRGQDFTRGAGKQAIDGIKGAGPPWNADLGRSEWGMKIWTNPAEGIKQGASGRVWFDKPVDERRKEGTRALREGAKNGGDWFGSGADSSEQRRHGSKSTGRKAASAMIAKIPLPLSRHIARTFYPH